MADLFLAVGASVVKLACKIWLRDHEFAADASGELVDVVKTKVTGDLDRRQTQRFFEDLEVPVAKKLEVLRLQEFAGIGDNEWNAAVLAVRDTLDRAPLTDADVFAGDLDPLYLRRHVREQAEEAVAAAARDLAAVGIALYERLLGECCAYVVELTTALPEFHVGAFSEVLRRQTVILRRVNELLEKMPGQEEARAGQEQAEAGFEAAYRRQVANQLDRLELFGVTLSDSVRGYPLSTAYISLEVAGDSLLARSERDAFRMRLTDDKEFPAAELASRTLRIDDALVATRRLFLRGEAGSGKTTLMQWLAVRAARRDFTGALSDWNELVPFLIRLRHHVGADLPPPERFLGQVGQHIADEMPRGWVHRLLREGRALILVDGVDELPDRERRRARDWLRGLVETYPGARYVVTSRPAAAGAGWLDREGFDVAEVQPMSWPDVRAFVRHWHAAMRDGSTDEDQRAHLSACEAALLDLLYARRHLRLLATNPLLCALVCALHLDRRMQLPRDRMELYAVALDMLLERRDSERRIPDAGLALSKTDQMLLLEDLAYWLIRNGWSDAAKDRTRHRLAQRLTSMPRVVAESGVVLDHLLERSGLLREPVAGRIDFVHRTFAEYLGGRAAVNEDQIGELVRNAHDDQWREVVVLAAGHAQRHQRDELLRGLLGRAEAEPRRQQALQILAVACLETSPQLDPDLHARIERVAEALLPPRGVRQAEVLARTGEFLLDLLADRPIRGARQAAATIRAASLIGGDPALKLIEKCAAVDGSSVADELMRAWPLFDVKEYARRVLSGSPHGRDIWIRDPGTLPGLPRICGLRRLNVSFVEGHGDLSVVAELPQLTILNMMEDPALVDLNALAAHQKLEEVWLQCRSTVDIAPLESVPHLSSLTLWPDRVANIETIRRCGGLAQLRLIEPSLAMDWADLLPPQPLWSFGLTFAPLKDLVPLLVPSSLAELEHLDLFRCDELGSLDGIQRWTGTLRYLHLTGEHAVADLTPLVGLMKLELVNISGGVVSDLSPLRELPALRTLTLVFHDGPVDLTPLRGVPSLTVNARPGQRVEGADDLGLGSKVVRRRW